MQCKKVENSELNKESKITVIRNWLNRNKIFFETVAVVLLSVMAIIISYVQVDIARKQTELIEIQTEIAQKEFESKLKKERIEKTAHWGELRNALWKIFDLYPPSGTESIRSLSQKQQLLFFKKIREILDSQIKNPVLIEDKQCLGYWRNAISAAKTYSYILSGANALELQDAIIASANGILKDVGYVWTELILQSDEVSPTGGRPTIKKENIEGKNNK